MFWLRDVLLFHDNPGAKTFAAMLRSLVSVSLLVAPAAGFNLAARFPKTLATCDARRSSDAVARLGFLQDTRMGEMAGAESTTYGDLYTSGMSPLVGMYGGIASTRGYGMGGMYGRGMSGGYGGGMGMGRGYGMNRGYGGGYGGYGMGMGGYGRGRYGGSTSCE